MVEPIMVVGNDLDSAACGECGRLKPSSVKPQRKRPWKPIRWYCPCGALVVVVPLAVGGKEV